MPGAPVITLTTDFGVRDPYVAAMKGVLLRRCPHAQVVDLSHSIAPQDLIEAALFIAGAAPWFPPKTIHVVVIDPGVGTARRPVAVAAGGQYFICPDNGLLSLYLRDHPLEKAREIANPVFMREDISATFHGRDVFAPCAGHLAAGADWTDIGPALDQLVHLGLPQPQVRGGDVTGEVIHIDHFGNAITNIHQSLVPEPRACRVQVAGAGVMNLAGTYADAPQGTPLALIGSAGYLEIAINRGNASESLGLTRGIPVSVSTRSGAD